MQKTIRVVLAAFAVLLLGIPQGASQSFTGFNAFYQSASPYTTTGPDNNPPIGKGIALNGAVGFMQIVWTVTGAPAACTVALDSSNDGVSFSAGGAIAGQTCTSAGNSVVTAGIFSFVRINVTALSAGATLTVKFFGWTSNPAGATSISGLVGTVQGQPLVGGASGAATNPSYLDTSVFSGANANCSTTTNVNGDPDWANGVNLAYVASGKGVTLDARGGVSVAGVPTRFVAYATRCNPFSVQGGSNALNTKGYLLLMPAGVVFTSVPWVTPRRGGIIRGVAPGDASAISSNANNGSGTPTNQRGSYLIACNPDSTVGVIAHANYGCGQSLLIGRSFAGNAMFPSNGYIMHFLYPHGPMPGYPTIIISNSTTESCTNVPRAHLTNANFAAGALTGNAIIDDNGVGNCNNVTNPTCVIGYGGFGNLTGTTCTITNAATVTQIAVAGGSGFRKVQGDYACLICMGGEADNGTCGEVPIGGGCNGLPDSGGWTLDAFDSRVEYMGLSLDNIDFTEQTNVLGAGNETIMGAFMLYSKNEQELSGGDHLELHDLADFSAGIFWDNSDVETGDSSGENSHAIHPSFHDVQLTGGKWAPDSPGTWGVINTSASIIISLNQGSCNVQPFATVTGTDNSGNPTTVKVTYHGGNTASGGQGCAGTPPVCNVITMPHSGTGIKCAVTVGPTGAGANQLTGTVTAITLSGAGNGFYPNFTHSSPPDISTMTLNGQSSASRIIGGVYASGTQVNVHGIHCENIKGSGNESSIGVLLQDNAGACVRLGGGWENSRGGSITVVDAASNTVSSQGARTASVVHIANGSDNAAWITSISSNLGTTDSIKIIGRLLRDDGNDPPNQNNGGLSPLGCTAGCVTGVYYQGNYYGRRDTYAPGGQAIDWIVLGSTSSGFNVNGGSSADLTSGVPDVGLSRVGGLNGTGALAINGCPGGCANGPNNGDGSGTILAGGNVLEVNASDFTTTNAALTLITGLSKAIPGVTNARNVSVDCTIQYQNSAANVTQFAIVTTVTAQPMVAWGNAYTADGVAHETPAGGTGVITTTTPTTALTITPAGTGVLVAELHGSIELPAFGTTTLNVDGDIAAAATLTVKRGSKCVIW